MLLLRYIPVVFLSAVLAVPGLAQTFQAQLTGIVKDPSGATVAGATVVARNLATNVKATTESNDQGLYRFQALLPGQYQVTSTKAGFKGSEQWPLTLNVNDIATLDVTLQVGDSAEKVVVNASAETLQTQTATVGQVVRTEQIEGLPLNVRDPLALVGLTPGVTFGSNFGNGGGQELGRNFFKSDFNVGGGRSGSQELLLDGAPNTTADVNRAIINPPVDSVQEFKVQTNSYDSEFGRTSGGVVNVITKSGTNDFHGTLYDFERHSVIEANNWFNNRAGIPNPSFKRHQFGANASGPVIKNKTFFFADYEGLRQGFPVTFVSTVPTALQKAGDFSQTRANDNTLIQVYDPDTLTTLANGTRQRTPFPGNVVPQSRMDAVARKVASYYPAATQIGDPITNQQNYVRSAGSNIDTDKWDARLDHNFNEKTRLFGRYSFQKDVRLVPGPLEGPIGGGRSTTDTYRQAIADLTRVITPNLIFTGQFGFSRALAAQFGLSKGFDLAQLGFSPDFLRYTTDQFIQGGVSDMASLSNGGDSFIQYQPRNSWTSRAGMAWSRGEHNLKWGVDYRLLNFNEGQNTQPSGTFNFGRTFTQGPNPLQASRNGGFGLADLLLGYPNGGGIRQLSPISTQGRYFALYFQDDWRATAKLSFNIGLRWDLSASSGEKWNRLAYFDPNIASPLAGPAGLPNLKGALRWIGKENPSTTQATSYTDFAPRLGMAYKLSSKAVFRAGYGIFFVPRNIIGNGSGAVTTFRDTSYVASIDGGLTPAGRLSNPFPQGVLPTLNDRDPLANVGQSLQVPVQDFKSGYAQQFSLGVQWEMPGGIMMQANYWGNRGSHLLSGNWNINQLPNQYLALGNALNDQVPNPFFGLIQVGALSGRTISRRQSLLPFPQYSGDGGVQQTLIPAGNSSYHAGSFQAEKKFSPRLTFLANYTWSKGIDDVGGMIDVYNRRLNKALSGFDTPHQLLLSWVYQLPYGRGRQHGTNIPVVLNAIVGGWDLNGIVRVQSGNPISVSTPSVNNGTSAKLDNPTIARWFNTSVFSNAAPFTFGTVGPRLPDVRTDFTRNGDIVLAKNFTSPFVGRELKWQFRAECYNLTNSVQFAGPNGSVTSQAFGQVTSQRNTSRQFQFALKLRF